MLADAALALATAYHLLGALYYKAAEKPPKEKEFSFPSLSVHVPAYKEDPEMVRNTVLKIMERLRPDQVIVVTDPDSYRRLRELLPPEVEVITGAEEGKARGLNKALKYTEAEYVMVFDADSYPEEGFAVKDVPVGASLWRGYSSGTRWGEALAKLTTVASIGLIYGRRRLGLPVLPPGSGVLVKRELLEAVGGWSEDALTEDLDTALKLLERGYEADVLPSFALVEAPPTYSALKRQQARWSYGALQALKRRVKAALRRPELFFYLTHYAVTWLPLLALVLSPLGLSPLWLLAYYASVALEGHFSKRASEAWGVELTLADAARSSAAGLAMSLSVLSSMLKALVGLPMEWVVTPKGKKRASEGGVREEFLLLLSPIFSLLNPISLPLALQYFASSAFVIKEVLSEERRRH